MPMLHKVLQACPACLHTHWAAATAAAAGRINEVHLHGWEHSMAGSELQRQ
jgi:hypothetical protein